MGSYNCRNDLAKTKTKTKTVLLWLMEAQKEAATVPVITRVLAPPPLQ